MTIKSNSLSFLIYKKFNFVHIFCFFLVLIFLGLKANSVYAINCSYRCKWVPECGATCTTVARTRTPDPNCFFSQTGGCVCYYQWQCQPGSGSCPTQGCFAGSTLLIPDQAWECCFADPTGAPVPSSTPTPTPAPNFYTIGGNIDTGAAVNYAPNIPVDIYDSNLTETRRVYTDVNGYFSITNFVRVGDCYAVRPQGDTPQTTTQGWTWMGYCAPPPATCPPYCDTPLGSPSYEYQKAGQNDCAGPAGGLGAAQRCDFNYPKPSNLNVVCGNQTATFSWAGVAGINDYILRIDYDNGGWFRSPPPPLPPEDQWICVTGTTSTTSIQMGAPGYIGWSVQAANPGCSVGYGRMDAPGFMCPLCSITASNVYISGVGGTGVANVVVYPTPPTALVNQVEYFITPPPIVTVLPPNPNPTPPWQGTFQASALGTTTYTAVATVGGYPECQATANVTVTVFNSPWWQAVGGDLVAATGNIKSLIPNCPITLDCDALIRDDPIPTPPQWLGHPGVPSAAGSITYGNGIVSSRGWIVQNEPYRGTEPYSYKYFENKIPTEVANDPAFTFSNNPVDGGCFDGSTVCPFGVNFPAGSNYWWYKYVGIVGLTINPPPLGFINLSNRRVILFVANGSSLAIGTKIRMKTPGTSGFYGIVSGDIKVSSSVGTFPPSSSTDPDTDRDIEAILFADGRFSTGTTGTANEPQLHIRGSVAARGFALQRDLQARNGGPYPAEVFHFAPELLLGWPPFLTGKNIIWKEVEP